jgi:Mrp family chromosome partitioning ATPase
MATQAPAETQAENRAPEWGPSEKVAEYCRCLLRRLAWSGNGAAEPIRTLGITSCYRGEGVSTLAVHLAATAACYEGQRVVLVDCNLARPSAARTFELEADGGLLEALSHPEAPQRFVQASGVRGLSVLQVGRTNGSAAEIWDTGGFRGILEALKRDFQLVVCDMPAASHNGLGGHLAGMMDGVLLVVEAERVRREVIRRTIEELERSGVHLLGAVLNKRRHHVPAWLYRTL